LTWFDSLLADQHDVVHDDVHALGVFVGVGRAGGLEEPCVWPGEEREPMVVARASGEHEL
jgi:hypothetical protein